MYAREIIFPLPPCGDYLPLLAIQDGRLGEMVSQCLDQEGQGDTLAVILGDLYPNGSWNG